ncbi:MAG: 4-hydroxybutyryl-CoA dehydratase [Deltaproteobacteria bacterium]|nr:4-hydroxybutyryl-CoA dehydratase [Deltaproteobacteria bacterium]MBW2116328.1 4-hydroxybutyryl-CoA dehydratase [Deltaproteobacteria bacterium]MBW2342588.1 4-hydroxybutyryl-CoA dehydratase [Deltaproteobacteria bacterium]
MALMTKEQYLSSLRGLGHQVFIQGEKVESVPDHPISKPPAMAMAETYQQAEQEDMKALFTAQSHLTGETINRFTHIQHNIEDLVNKILMLREMGRKTACCFQRCAGLDCMNSVYAITYELDQGFGTRYHDRFADFMKYMQSNDLVPAACMTDSKGDRSLSPSKQEDPDQYVHIVEEKNRGIVVRGAKMHITGGVNSHEVIVMPTRALQEEDKDYAVAFAVPANTEGITFIYGRQPSDTRRLEANRSDTGNLYYGGCESMVVFDDVFVPEERIFMKGEYPFAGRLVELFASHHRASYGGCKVGVGDVLIGATAAIAEAHGTEKTSHIKDKIAEMIHLNETLHAGALASAGKGYKTPSGAYAVDHLLANVCKLNITRFPFDISRLAQDIAGGLLVTMPSLDDQDNPEIGPYIKKYLVGKSGVDSEKRVRILRLIENITLGTGAVSYLTESIHGAGSPQAQKIMITRLADIESAKSCAYKLCGL